MEGEPAPDYASEDLVAGSFLSRASIDRDQHPERKPPDPSTVFVVARGPNSFTTRDHRDEQRLL